MNVSRLGVFLAVVFAVVIGFVLGSVVMPSSAAQFSSVCPLADRAGKPLVSQDLNAQGDTRCWYGEAHDPLYPCEDSPVWNAMTWSSGANEDGQTKCVYRTFLTRPTITPIARFRGLDSVGQPPEATREAAP